MHSLTLEQDAANAAAAEAQAVHATLLIARETHLAGKPPPRSELVSEDRDELDVAVPDMAQLQLAVLHCCRVPCLQFVAPVHSLIIGKVDRFRLAAHGDPLAAHFVLALCL